ncbi:hypothetical protein ACFPH6_33005 [Streptomyces xiangluensis]|uniref:Uncharacterized protein n=1 Tax=Streptomyces xiangluensis TaxID=2665720 RepID=A0ABV8YYT6_9ACTN
MRVRVEDFVTFTSQTATALARPGETIPADPHGPLGTARFRRTLAWHIARRPGGLVALAIQYGHLRTAISGGYASRSRDGIDDLLDVETARATVETLTTLHEDLTRGAGISGPAAHRAIHAATRAATFIQRHADDRHSGPRSPSAAQTPSPSAISISRTISTPRSRNEVSPLTRSDGSASKSSS